GKLLAGGFSFGEYDVLALIEAPSDVVMAGLALSIAAAGAVKSAKTTKLLSGQEWVEALRAASGSGYRPAR
ncbi:MAG TPA: GYD domain-containing protein, partial [Chloroflexota bacterium]|nr:GYD domain-containing protein [Chloroflexota bacterium]